MTRCRELCAAYEAEFNKDAWRRTDPDRAAYLTHLVSLGYTPCDTEQLMIDNATAHPDGVDQADATADEQDND